MELDWTQLAMSDLLLLAVEMGIEIPQAAEREQLVANVLSLDWDSEDIADLWLDIEKGAIERQRKIDLQKLELDLVQKKRELRKLAREVTDSKDLVRRFLYLFSDERDETVRESKLALRGRTVHAPSRDKSRKVATEADLQRKKKVEAGESRPTEGQRLPDASVVLTDAVSQETYQKPVLDVGGDCHPRQDRGEDPQASAGCPFEDKGEHNRDTTPQKSSVLTEIGEETKQANQEQDRDPDRSCRHDLCGSETRPRSLSYQSKESGSNHAVTRIIFHKSKDFFEVRLQHPDAELVKQSSCKKVDTETPRLDPSSEVIEPCKKQDLRRIAKATGAQLLVSLANMEGEAEVDASMLGVAEYVVQGKVCDDELIFIKKPKVQTASSIVVRGDKDYFVDGVERSIHDALCVVRCVLESKTVVPGGCAVEAALSIYLENFADDKNREHKDRNRDLNCCSGPRKKQGVG